MYRKLDRMRQDPHVALAFHTRAHGRTDRPEHVLVQGRASVPPFDDPDAWLEAMGENWERASGHPREVGRLWEWWLRDYHWRVNVEIAIERIVVWPDLECRGEPDVLGAPLPAEPPPPQRPPANGVDPRLDHRRAARRAARLPDVLLGWVGADRFPVVVPVRVAGAEERGIRIEAASALLPPGGRRAGLLAHWFSRHVVGQNQRRHTGWLVAEPGGRSALYAPHTAAAYRFPASRLAFFLAAGFGTRRGMRQARRAGFVPG